MAKNKSQRKRPLQGTASPIESIKDLGRDLVKKTTKDLIGGVATDAFRQVTGPAGEVGLEQEKIRPQKEQAPKPFIAVKERALYVEENKREITYQADLILAEIKQLAQETDGLKKELNDFALEELPEDPGQYHLSFLGRILNLIEKARQAIHDAATWLAVANSRRQKKGLLAGYGFGKGKKSASASIQKMLGGEMGASRSGA